MLLHSSVRGEGPPLVLIHGLLGSLENLGGIARLLADTFRCYSLDLPNHGRSPHSDAFSLAAMAQNLSDWMDTQGLAHAHFVGHSLGGKVAMELALRHPARVDRLLVLDIAPQTYQNRHVDIFEGLQAIDLALISSRSEADTVLQQWVPEEAVRSFLLKNLQKNAQGQLEWRMNLTAIAGNYEGLIVENTSGCFDKPTLFIKGALSDYITEASRPAIESRFPQASLKVVAQAGHWLHAEKPALLASMIRKFLLKP